MPAKNSKYNVLLEDPEVKRWLKNIERGSLVTADVAIRRFGKVSELLKLSPKDMVSQAKRNPKIFQDRLEDLVAKLTEEKKAPNTSMVY